MVTTIASIYNPTVVNHTRTGIPDDPDLLITMIDTNVWTNLAKAANNSPTYFPLIPQKMFHKGQILVVPEVILRECAGNGVQASMNAATFHSTYNAALTTISNITDIHVVTFADMEALMMNSNGGSTERALRRALIIANELFANNEDVKKALANVTEFTEIEDALTVIPDDAGERVILFFTMLFLNESWDVDVLTNETAVYTDRRIVGMKDKLRAAINDLTKEAFYDAYKIASYDVILFEVMVDNEAIWTMGEMKDFVTQCRTHNRGNRKLRVMSHISSFADTQNCGDNHDFLTKYYDWTGDSTRIVF